MRAHRHADHVSHGGLLRKHVEARDKRQIVRALRARGRSIGPVDRWRRVRRALGRSAAENSSNRPADGLATVLGGVAAPVFRLLGGIQHLPGCP